MDNKKRRKIGIYNNSRGAYLWQLSANRIYHLLFANVFTEHECCTRFFLPSCAQNYESQIQQTCRATLRHIKDSRTKSWLFKYTYFESKILPYLCRLKKSERSYNRKYCV